MISIYTDASVSQGVAVASCMLLTNHAYIGFNSTTYNDIWSSQVGELLAIRDGLKLYSETDIKDEEAVLYTDHEYAIRLIEEGDASKFSEAQGLLEEIIELAKASSISVQHITAHQSIHNPNKVVDQISRHKLRSTLKKGRRKCQNKN